MVRGRASNSLVFNEHQPFNLRGPEAHGHRLPDTWEDDRVVQFAIEPSYFDRFYPMQLGQPKEAKHIVIRLPWSARDHAGLDWIDDVGQFAAIVWTGENIPSEDDMSEELEAHEFVLA